MELRERHHTGYAVRQYAGQLPVRRALGRRQLQRPGGALGALERRAEQGGALRGGEGGLAAHQRAGGGEGDPRCEKRVRTEGARKAFALVYGPFVASFDLSDAVSARFGPVLTWIPPFKTGFGRW